MCQSSAPRCLPCPSGRRRGLKAQRLDTLHFWLPRRAWNLEEILSFSSLLRASPCSALTPLPRSPGPRRFRLRTGAPQEETVPGWLPPHLGVPRFPPASLPRRRIAKPGAVCLFSLLPCFTPTPTGPWDIPPPRCTPTSGGARAGVMQASGRGARLGPASSPGFHRRFGEGPG